MSLNRKMQGGGDPGKESRTNSDMESLLVSSVRYEPTVYYSQTQGDSRPIRTSQRGSLIKKNVVSNVVIEETHRCCCESKLQAVNSSIQLLSLTVQEIQSKLALIFNKQAGIQSQLSSLLCHKQQDSSVQWQLGVKIQEQVERSARTREQFRLQLSTISQEMRKVKNGLVRLEPKNNEKCMSSKLLQHKFERYKAEQEFKMSFLLESIDQVSALQKRIMNSCQKEPSTFPDEDSTLLPCSVDPAKRMKVLRGCSMGRNRTCESTNISYSRNTDK